jgi:AraC-like DNA-binding protein
MGNFLLFAVFFSGLLGFVVSLVLVFANKAETFSARLLAWFLFVFSFFAIYFGLQFTGFFRRFPHLLKTLVWVSFLYMPLSYLYVRSVLWQSFRFKKIDFLFLLPAIIYTASYIPFFLKPAAVKILYFDEMAKHPEYITMEPYSMLPPWTGYAMRVLLGIGCVAGQFYHLSKWKQRTRNGIGREPRNIQIYRWLWTFAMILAVYNLLITIQLIFKTQVGQATGPAALYTVVATILFVCLSLLFRPMILYGMFGWDGATTPSIRTSGSPLDHGRSPEALIAVVEGKKKTYLSAAQGQVIKGVLEEHLMEKRPFLMAGYSIAQLSHELKIPSYQLSGFINQEYGRNFNELINEYRVNYLLSRLKERNSFTRFTLEAIGREAGFNSRAAFIAAVRKVTGKTPSEVLGRRGRDIEEDT